MSHNNGITELLSKIAFTQTHEEKTAGNLLHFSHGEIVSKANAKLHDERAACGK